MINLPMKRILCVILVLVLSYGLNPVTASAHGKDIINKAAILSAVFGADIASAREAIDTGLISCEELTEYYIERINEYNKEYNCFITMCDDALDVAKARDKALADGEANGLLFGIPVVVKDNIDVEGYHTTNGHAKTDDQIADSNAEVVNRLLAHGAVIIAKTNMSTDAQSARDSTSKAAGKTKNAYNTYLSPAGSSGGSAVATSLNFAAAALGTDTNSSLRLPAAYAGCISLRGTLGLIPRDGITALNDTRDVPGAITRTVYDQAIMLDVLTNSEYEYTKNLDNNALNGLRIGVLKELCYPVAGRSDRTEPDIDSEVTAAFASALDELRAMGAEITEVSMPEIFSLSNATKSKQDPAKKDALYKAFEDMLEANCISAVIFPTYLSAPLRLGKDDQGKSWSVWSQKFINNCGILAPSASLPEISIPIGLHSLGCGIGMEIAAKRGQEQLLLNIAYSYTLIYDHRAVPAGAPDKYAESNIGSLRELTEAYVEALKPTPTPTPTPTASPTPTPTADPTPTAGPSPTPTASPSPMPTPTASPGPMPTASPMPTTGPTPTPTQMPTVSPMPMPTASPSPTPTASPMPTPMPTAGPSPAGQGHTVISPVQFDKWIYVASIALVVTVVCMVLVICRKRKSDK